MGSRKGFETTVLFILLKEHHNWNGFISYTSHLVYSTTPYPINHADLPSHK